jgi:hypothetical protein
LNAAGDAGKEKEEQTEHESEEHSENEWELDAYEGARAHPD